MMTWLLIVLIAVSAVLAIAAHMQNSRRGIYIFKPLTTALIILLALLADGDSESYQILIIVGLLFSLAGDVFLMLPRDLFIAGLVSFLIAHLFYSVAFLKDGEISWLLLIPLLGFGGIMLAILWPHLGKLKTPVIVYVGVILIMGWLAVSRWLETDREGAALAALGALFFMASDTILALDRFRKPFGTARLLVLSTYYLAQTLIALSI